jgi:hypothetical protein
MRAYLAYTPVPSAPPLAAESDPGEDKLATAASEPLGKKAQANEDAKLAHKGTSWDDLLSPSAPVQ